MKKIFENREQAQAHANEMKAMLREKGVEVKNIPAVLKERNQWVAWQWSVGQSRGGFVTTKIPLNAKDGSHASHSDPKSWSSFDKALETYKTTEDIAGLGYVFSRDDELVGVDFDNCIDESKQIHPEILEIISGFECYMEASPSMTGLKVFGLGSIPKESLNTEAGSGFKIHDFPNEGMDIEVYQHSRFFTVTSIKMKSKPAEIADIQGMINELSTVKKNKNGEKVDDVQVELDMINAEADTDFPEYDDAPLDSQPVPETPPAPEPTPETLEPKQEARSFTPRPQSQNGNGIKPTPAEIIEKITASKQSSVFHTLYYEGNTTAYPSHSEADLALTSILCWWCQGDRMEAEKLFAGSQLVRPKWENRQDYRDGLWLKADTGSYYMPQELTDPQNLPPISSLERQIDVVSKWLKESDSYNQEQTLYVLPDSVRYDGFRVVLDCVINGKNVSKLLVSDYVCAGLSIKPMSLWKRDSQGKFTEIESKGYWREINNFAADIVGNTGGWGRGINRHATAAEEALEALGL